MHKADRNSEKSSILFVCFLTIGVVVTIAFFVGGFLIACNFKPLPTSIQFNASSCTLSCVKDGILEALDSYQERFDSCQNWLVVWSGVITIVFLVFSILGLYKIDEKLKLLERKGEGMLSRMKEETNALWEVMSTVTLAKSMTPDRIDVVQERAFSLLKPEFVSDANLSLYFLTELGHAQVNAGCFENAIENLSEAISLASKIESNSKIRDLKLYILYYYRGRAHRERALKKKEHDARLFECEIKESISDFDKALALSIENRFSAFVCVEIAVSYLRCERFSDALRYCDYAENYCPINGSADDTRGDIYAYRWRKVYEEEYFSRAVTFYKRAFFAPARQGSGKKNTYQKYIKILSEKKHFDQYGAR